MRASLLLLCTLPFAACSSSTAGHGGPGSTIDGLVSIDVEPANQTLIIDGTTAAKQGYTAKGTFADGHVADLTAQVIFTVADVGLGAFAGPAFTSGVDHGGSTQVSAVAGQVQGVTGLTLQMKQRYSDPGSTGLPAEPERPLRRRRHSSLRGAARLSQRRRAPAAEPRQARDPLEARRRDLALRAALRQRRHRHRGLRRLHQSDERRLHLPARSARCGTGSPRSTAAAAPLAVTVRATDGNGGGVGTSNAPQSAFSLDDINGGLYYWTTSGDDRDHALRLRVDDADHRLDVRRPRASASGKPASAATRSRATARSMVAEPGGQNDGRLLLLDVATAMPMVAFGSTPKSIFETWNPSSAQLRRRLRRHRRDRLQPHALQRQQRRLSRRHPRHRHGGATRPTTPTGRSTASSIAYVKDGRRRAPTSACGPARSSSSRSSGGMTWSAPTELVPSVARQEPLLPVVLARRASSSCTTSRPAPPAPTPTARATPTPIPPRRCGPSTTAAGATPINLAKCQRAAASPTATTTALTNSFPRWSPFVFQRTHEVAGRA